ncbi:30S ribosomal protein S20 [Patescibacteria group bacterium]|nr:30S ribosomal protein S20 [Patescibacteria group bacterium]
MPNKHAAIKDLRKNKKRALHNKRMKTHIKSLTQQLVSLVKEGKKSEATTAAQKLQQTLNKASREMIIHRNNASRKTAKAQLMVNKLAK